MNNTIRTRPDIWHLGVWDSPILWYARAVGKMQQRTIGDVSSWRYQAAIHDYIRQRDPFAQPTDPLPSNGDQQRFWRQCQHSSWFFLPWHRMYLFYFEQTVADTIVKLGGPSGWSLPFWNYSDAGANAPTLPPAFRSQNMPDGSVNPLYVSQRDAQINNGAPLPPSAVNLAALTDGHFIGTSIGAHPDFGGPKTVGNHGGGPIGALEKTPHGDVHSLVGGFMGAFNTAGLDPIFWLHHANIDRLWELWRGSAGTVATSTDFTNPADPDWLAAKGATFTFHDASGSVQPFLPSQAVDTTAAPLLYQYEAVPPPRPFAAAAARGTVLRMSDQIPAEMVGATTRAVSLASRPLSASLPLKAATGPARLTEAIAPDRKRIFLNLENITGTGPLPVYEVYLNPSAGLSSGQISAEFLAGTMPMFGVMEASEATDRHDGSGITYVLEVTDLVAKLKSQNRWNPTQLTVTFKPLRPLNEGATASVGRISLYEQ